MTTDLKFFWKRSLAAMRRAYAHSNVIPLVAVLFAAALFDELASAATVSSDIVPGAVWRDTDGHPINAHGGGMLFYRDTYYWYGEFKSGRTYLPDCNKSWGGTRVDTVGVSCYSSTNLCDWKYEGIVLPAVPGDPQSDLYPGKVLERPKVIYNQTTKMFVMWMHIDSADYAAARCGVAVSKQPTGPFKYLGSFRPDACAWPENVIAAEKAPGNTNLLARDFKEGQMARDMTVFEDDDGKAYLFYSSEGNPTMHVSLLTEDYLRTSGKYHRIFVGRSMEAPAVFKRNGKYYLIASGCTAWAPNAARLAVADHLFGPWTELGNPCQGADADNTFHSQSTFVFPVAGRDNLFIFMADRWNQWNLPNSRYVWLPIEFTEAGKPVLTWHEHWSVDGMLDHRTAQNSARDRAHAASPNSSPPIYEPNGNITSRGNLNEVHRSRGFQRLIVMRPSFPKKSPPVHGLIWHYKRVRKA
jgi:Glycosyl hydrolases family 43